MKVRAVVESRGALEQVSNELLNDREAVRAAVVTDRLAFVYTRVEL